MEYADYSSDQVLVGCIVDVSPETWRHLKKEIVNFVVGMQSDDRFYIFDPDQTSILRKSGQFVASVANYRISPIDLSTAVKWTEHLLASEEGWHAEKLIFIIADHYDSEYDRSMRKPFDVDIRDRYENRFFVYGIGSQCEGLEIVTDMHPKCQFKLFPTTDGLSEDMIKNYEEIAV
jgi:hypothetical protein